MIGSRHRAISRFELVIKETVPVEFFTESNKVTKWLVSGNLKHTECTFSYLPWVLFFVCPALAQPLRPSSSASLLNSYCGGRASPLAGRSSAAPIGPCGCGGSVNEDSLPSHLVDFARHDDRALVYIRGLAPLRALREAPEPRAGPRRIRPLASDGPVLLLLPRRFLERTFRSNSDLPSGDLCRGQPFAALKNRMSIRKTRHVELEDRWLSTIVNPAK